MESYVVTVTGPHVVITTPRLRFVETFDVGPNATSASVAQQLELRGYRIVTPWNDSSESQLRLKAGLEADD